MSSAQTYQDTRAGGPAYDIWPKLAALHNSGNPLGLLLQMARHHDGCIPLQMRSQRVFLLTEAQHFKHVLQTNGANYTKYLDGMTPIFGGSMITMDGALWQKMRVLQQPAFHPDMMSDYVPHFLTAIGKAKNRMTQLARSGEPVDICEETWALAADMTCKALFDRETPFNPYFVFKAVKAFTNVTNHDFGRRQSVDDGSRNGNDGEIATRDRNLGGAAGDHSRCGSVAGPRADAARDLSKRPRRTKRCPSSTGIRCSTRSSNTSGPGPRRRP